ISFSSDGHHALVGEEKNLVLLDLVGDHELRRFQGHQAELTSVALLPDGRRALSSSLDLSVRLWDLETGQEIRRFSGPTTVVKHVAVTPDGRRVMASSGDMTTRNGPPTAEDCFIRTWEVDSGKEVHRFEKHRYPVRAFSLSADGRRALSSDGQET